MQRRKLLAAMLLLPVAGALLPQPASAQQGEPGKGGKPDRGREERASLTAREAAARARARHGGEVLNVMPSGRDFRVRLLLKNGRVITVTVKG